MSKNLLRVALKFQLPVIHDKRYIQYIRHKHPGKELHHIIHRKNGDYLIVPLTRNEHMLRHKNPDKYFEEDLVVALKELFFYLEEVKQ